MVAPPATRRPDPRHVGTPLQPPSTPAVICSAPRVETERTFVCPSEGQPCPSPGHSRLL